MAIREKHSWVRSVAVASPDWWYRTTASLENFNLRPFEALNGPIRPLRPHKALEGLIRLLRDLYGP